MFQRNAFQNSAFAHDGIPVVPVVVVDQTPAGSSKSSRSSRKRFILPDGRHVLATQGEVEALLEQFVQKREEPRKRKRRTPAVIELEGVRWEPVRSAPEIVTVKLPQDLVLRANPRDMERALKAIQRRLDDEEAILLLI
jgi:hypothetical protein